MPLDPPAGTDTATTPPGLGRALPENGLHDLQPSTRGEDGVRGKLTAPTRRNFIRGIAAAGASTATAVALERTGLDLFGDEARAQAAPAGGSFADFRAIPASSADAFQVPEGYRADVVIRFGDTFTNDSGQALPYGYNNDWIGYYALDLGSDYTATGDSSEGLLYVNHEYPDPFFLHGYKPDGSAKSGDRIRREMEVVGASIIHIRKNPEGLWQVVQGSQYNRRFTGSTPAIPFTGPLAGQKGIGASAKGTVGNCSGGTTPWGTALTCEENYDGYGLPETRGVDFAYAWVRVDPEYNANTNTTNAGGNQNANPDEYKKYGWVVEHDPYNPRDPGRKHTTLGRFRHENTAFHQKPGSRFVLYMGDDQANQGVYKFVSSRAFNPAPGQAAREENLQILTQGTLYVARWSPESRRRFATSGDVQPISPTSGTGQWLPLETRELADTRLWLGGFLTGETETDPADPTRTRARARRPAQNATGGSADPASPNYSGRFNVRVPDPKPGAASGAMVNEWDEFFATNRPEDLEVARDGSVYIALTNNSSVRDSHGSIRRLVEDGNNPEATSFTWNDYSPGGPRRGPDPTRQGFSSPDNLVFDSQDNLWVVTDISSSRLNGPNEYDYHANNAAFMVPTAGPNAGVAFRFANMPIESEGTGPYFTPNEDTLFLNVQHPGEVTSERTSSVFGQPTTYDSYWPNGNKTTGQNPSEPLPSLVAITRVRAGMPPGSPVIPPPAQQPAPPAPTLGVSASRAVAERSLLRSGMSVQLDLSARARQVRVTIEGRPRAEGVRGRRRRARNLLIARVTLVDQSAGVFRLKLRARRSARVLLTALRRSTPAVLTVAVTFADGTERVEVRRFRISGR